MKTISKYQQAKKILKNLANEYKEIFKDDKPAQREIINNSIDVYCSWFNLSDYQRDLLSNYACKLHPKN